LEEVLKTLDPRRCIVHLHGYTKALTAGPALAAKHAGFRTVCTLHDFFAACPNGAFYDYRRQLPCPLVALSPACIATPCDKRHQVHKAYRVARGIGSRLHHVVAAFSRVVATVSPAGRCILSIGQYHRCTTRAAG
jgi:hypothetical protein